MSLEVLVSTLLAFKATNPKDNIYAVLSIASDTPYCGLNSTELKSPLPAPDIRITPNYDHGEAEIFGDFIDYCIDTSESLDIICRYWAPAPKGRRRNMSISDLDTPRHLPTWVSVITGSAFGGPELGGTTSRKHHRIYNASGDLKPSYLVERIPRPERVIGSRLAGSTTIIHATTGSSSAQNKEGISKQMNMFVKGIRSTLLRSSRRECLEMGCWTTNMWDDDEKQTAVPEMLWMTLVADRGPNGSETKNWYHRACLDCFSHTSQNGILNTVALIDKPGTASTMIKFLKRVQEVVWNRKFLLSRGGEKQDEEKKLFGLAPTGAQQGDIIVILFGCSVPVLLREKGSPEDRYYYFVGEVYIHEKMDGEAVTKSMLPEYPYDGFTEFKLY